MPVVLVQWVVTYGSQVHNFSVDEYFKNRYSIARLFYIASFINSLANGVTGPLVVVYLLFLHINPAQIGVLLALGRLAVIIFEFPTGLFSDWCGRKKSLLISFALSSALLLGWFLSTGFYQFVFIFIASGLAFTFQSGSKESLMIDMLRLSRRDGLRNKFFVRTGSWANTGFVVGGLLAALLSFYALSSIWLVASICNVVLFIIFLFGVKESALLNLNTKQVGTRVFGAKKMLNMYVGHFYAASKSVLRTLLLSRPLLRLLGVIIFFSCATAAYGLAYPIYFKQTLGLPNYMFGILGSISALMGIVGMFIGEKICQSRGYIYTLKVAAISLLVLFEVRGGVIPPLFIV